MRIDIVVKKWSVNDYVVEILKKHDNGKVITKCVENFFYEPTARQFIDFTILTGVKKGYDVYRHYFIPYTGEKLVMRMNDLALV